MIELSFIIFNILKFCLSISLIFKVKRYPITFIRLSKLFLIIDLISVLINLIFPNNLKLPFLLLVNLHLYPYINILFIAVILLLLILYKGVEDRFQNYHRILVSFYFLASSLGYILLLIIN